MLELSLNLSLAKRRVGMSSNKQKQTANREFLTLSLNHKKELSEIAKIICRDLRRNSTKAEKIFWERVRNKIPLLRREVLC